MGNGVSFVCMFIFLYVGFVRDSSSCVTFCKKEKWNQNTKQKESETQNKGRFYHCLLSYANVTVK